MCFALNPPQGVMPGPPEGLEKLQACLIQGN